MTVPRRRPLRSRLWRRLRSLVGRGEPPAPPVEPPDEEPALVPTGPPRRPLRGGAVSLDLPEEPRDVDARGRPAA